MESGDSDDLNFSSIEQEKNIMSTNTGFDEEGFDDVFVDDPPSADLESPSGFPIRARRISDVIDSIGDKPVSPVPDQRHSSSSATGEMISSATSPPRNIVPPLNGSRQAELLLAMESIDLGYSSPGARTSRESSWFRTSINSDADSIDAKPITEKDKANSKKNSNNTGNVEIMPVIKDALCYNMNHEYRGFAVIINHDYFENDKLSVRKGSEKDVAELTKMFYKLDFSVVVWNNFDKSQISKKLNDLADHDHSNNDCLAVVVLSHGIGSSYIYAKDIPYSAEMLWNTFTPDKCTTLAGKPKIFFVQACRGDKLDGGFTLQEARTEVDSSPQTAYTIPTQADFLIAFSSYEGHYSFRHPLYGTWFIQSLCMEVAKNDLSSLDFLSVMTRVSRRVALDFDSYAPETPWLHGMKQIPTIHTLLIRDLYFKRKNSPPPEPVIIT